MGLPESNFCFSARLHRDGYKKEAADMNNPGNLNSPESERDEQKESLAPGRKFAPDTPVDALCLEQAWNIVRVSTDSTIKQCAAQFDVPLDVLEGLVCDRFIFRRTGQPPCPTEWFVEEANERRGQEDQERVQEILDAVNSLRSSLRALLDL
jgi:hypothetical protein